MKGFALSERFYQFPCGCKFRIVEENPPDGVQPLLDFDIENVPLDCPATFALLGTGRTKGVFQLESSLGKQWTKRLKPENVEHLTALSAILRPGCLQSKTEDGVSMTMHYTLRKNGDEPVDSYHPAIDAILWPTYNVLSYQEQAIMIAKTVAGFDELTADYIRKAAGKKDTILMAKCEEMFLEGAKKTGILSDAQAIEVFGWIKKSQRYAFNRCISHNEKIRRAGNNKWGLAFLTVGEMWKIRNNLEYAKTTKHKQLRRKWMLLGNYGKGISMCEDGRIRPNLIVDIQPSGVQPVYKTTLSNGKSIRTTINHKFPTKFGVKTLSELMEIIKTSPVELFVCGTKEGRADYKRGEKGYLALTSTIVSIELDGEEETFDVTMDGPNHNFVTCEDIVTSNSHSVCYGGFTSYETAYIKTHFPVAFYSGYLNNAHYKGGKGGPQREMAELIDDARLFDVKVLPPDLRNLNRGFQTDRKVITFGLQAVKGVGEAQFNKLKAAFSKLEPEQKIKWISILFYLADQVQSNVLANLIKAGALSWLGVERQVMLTEHEKWLSLTDKERGWLRKNGSASLRLADNMKLLAKPKKEGGGCFNKNREAYVASLVRLLESPPSVVRDTPLSIAADEEAHLGISITYSRIDSCDTSAVNATCKEAACGRHGNMVLGVEVKDVKELKTKSGQNPGSKMGRFTLSDSSCSIEALAWPEAWKEVGSLFRNKNTLIVQGYRDKQGTFIVQKAWQAANAAG